MAREREEAAAVIAREKEAEKYVLMRKKVDEPIKMAQPEYVSFTARMQNKKTEQARAQVEVTKSQT